MSEGNWAEIWECYGTWTGCLVSLGLGVVGAIFISKQNKILSRQNDILYEQTKVMSNQADLNDRLIERDAIERDQQDTLDTLEKIHFGFFKNEDQIEKEIDRLLSKGLSFQQLRRRSLKLADENVSNKSILNRMDEIQEYHRRQRAIDALTKADKV